MSETVIRVGAAPPVLRGSADFLDGERAVVQRAQFRIRETPDGPVLEIRPPEAPPLYWPLGALRALPDQAGDDMLVLAPAEGGAARLLLRDAEARAVISARCPDLTRRPPPRLQGRLIAWALAAVGSVALIVFLLVPALADRLADLLPPEGERALGDVTYRQIRSAFSEDGLEPLPVCTGAAGLAALEAMQARIAGPVELPHPLRLEVLDHPMNNAFALPGGRIVLFRGLIEQVASPEEVAAVLAHEIGHVAGRDPTRGALRAAGSVGVVGLILGDFAGGALVQLLIGRLIEAGYSQAAEAAADDFAHRTLAAAGVRPSVLADIFVRLRVEGGDAPGIAAHFMDHPALLERIAAARRADWLLRSPLRPVLEPAEWAALRRICR